jgi:hypothetical protein
MEAFIDEGLQAARDEETRNWLTVLKGNVGLRWHWSGLEDPLSLSERIANAADAVRVAETLDDPALMSQAYRTYGSLESIAGAWDVTVEIARRDLRLADRLDSTERAFALFWNSLFLMEIAGEFSQHFPHAALSLEVAQALTPHERMHGTYTLMNASYHVGRWSDLGSLADEHLEALEAEPGVSCPYCRGGAALAAFVLVHQGRFDRAAESAAALVPDLDQPGLPEAWLARYMVARGDASAGRELAARIVGRPVSAEENAFEVLALLEAQVTLEDWQAVRAFLPQARTFGRALALIEPSSDRAEALAEISVGNVPRGEALLRGALASFEQMGVVFEAALTKERLAAVSPRAEAERLRREVLATYEQLGAISHLERLRTPASAPTASP